MVFGKLIDIFLLSITTAHAYSYSVVISCPIDCKIILIVAHIQFPETMEVYGAWVPDEHCLP